MAVVPEKVINKKTGKYVEKKVNGKIQYCIRTYITDHRGIKKQTTKHNPEWIGKDGYWLAQQEENRLKNSTVETEAITYNELINNYMEHIRTKLRPATCVKADDIFRLYVLPYFSGKKVNSTKNIDILKWHDKILKLNFSNRYNRNIHTTLVTLFNFGCKYYGIEKNIPSIVGNFEVPRGTKKNELNFLTLEEFQRFIKFEENPLYKSFFTILFFTGMRKGELMALTWDDINYETNEINIDKAFNPKNGKIMSPKTSKSNRKIKMLPRVIEEFKTLSKSNSHIFLNKITPTTLDRKCKNNCKKAEIKKNIRIHDFRHSFASLSITANVKIEIISQYLGHENISTTLDIYSHLYPNVQQQLIDCITAFEKYDQKYDQEKIKPFKNKGLIA